MEFEKTIKLVFALKELLEQILKYEGKNDELEEIIILLERVVKKSGVEVDTEPL